MSDRTTMMFTKEEFNTFVYYLQLYDDQKILDKIKRYSTFKEEDDKLYLSVGFFENEMRSIIWKLLNLLPEREDENLFDELHHQYVQRKIAYYQERDNLKANIRKELLANPNIKGTELAEKLQVSKDLVYSLWNDIKADIAKSTGNGA